MRRMDNLPSNQNLVEYVHHSLEIAQYYHLARVKIGLSIICPVSFSFQYFVSRQTGHGISFIRLIRHYCQVTNMHLNWRMREKWLQLLTYNYHTPSLSKYESDELNSNELQSDTERIVQLNSSSDTIMVHRRMFYFLIPWLEKTSESPFRGTYVHFQHCSVEHAPRPS